MALCVTVNVKPEGCMVMILLEEEQDLSPDNFVEKVKRTQQRISQSE